MRSSDALAAIHARVGVMPSPRVGSDGSLVVVGYLVSGPDADNLSEVSVLGSEPIGGVPTVPSTYTSVTTVYVLMQGSRPVQVLGPASTIVVGGVSGTLPDPPAAAASGTRTVTGRAVGPVGSGTYRVDRAAWDRWNVTTYGGAGDVYQAGSAASGTLYGLAWFGDQVVALGASEITKATLTLVSNGSGSSSTWSATVRGCASGTRPAGAPTYTGSTVSVTVPGYGKAGQSVTVDLDATMRGDLRTGAIKSLGLTGVTYGGTYGAGRAPGWFLSVDYTVVG